jgi:hypothetical protein
MINTSIYVKKCMTLFKMPLSYCSKQYCRFLKRLIISYLKKLLIEYKIKGEHSLSESFFLNIDPQKIYIKLRGSLNQNTLINQILIYFVIAKRGRMLRIIFINSYFYFKDEKINLDFIYNWILMLLYLTSLCEKFLVVGT